MRAAARGATALAVAFCWFGHPEVAILFIPVIVACAWPEEEWEK